MSKFISFCDKIQNKDVSKMKKIDVIVRDKNTLVLEEDAQKGDYIDLTSISNIDYRQIEEIVSSGKDEVYNKKLEEYKKQFLLETNQEKSELENRFKLDLEKKNTEIELFKTKLQQDMNLKQAELEHKHSLELQSLNAKIEQLTSLSQQKVQEVKLNYQLQLQDLQQKLSSFEDKKKMELEGEKLQLEKKYTDQLNNLNHQLEEMNYSKQRFELEKKLELETALRKKEQNFEAEKQQWNQKYEELYQSYQALQRQKASLNVKQTGEDLESWCDNEVRSYMQNGLENCKWVKDNVVVRETDETKGSKADYIFSIYESKNKETLLAGVCLDMKDENPDSVNRKKNADYYKALDNNRKKKDCKYAVLVSNLELDRPNDLPIFKVNEYEEMYVVRPAYLMTFLNMLVSLTTRFADLVLTKQEEQLELKDIMNLKLSFDELKNTYLDKPLLALSKNIEDIRSQNEKITSASRKIDELCDTVTRSYLNEIQNKLDRFDIKIEKAYKK